jgi:hypothetical protein
MNKTIKNQSPFVESVVALDSHFSELERLSAQIEKMDMSSDFDIERAQQMMNRFAECGQEVSTEIVKMSERLNEARMRAEASAQIVSLRANEMLKRKSEMQKKAEEFRHLGERVQAINGAMSELIQPSDAVVTEEDRVQLTRRLSEFEIHLQPLIEETQKLKKEAHDSNMKALERHADSLGQSLVAASQKLSHLGRQNHLQ